MLPRLSTTTGGGASSKLATLDLTQFAGLYHRGIFDKIIVLRDHFGTYSLLPLKQLRIAPEDILLVNRLEENIDVAKFIEPYFSAKFLPYLEFHIADHCNLNCKACTHYAGLVREPHFPNLQKFTQDFEQLHKFIDDISRIRILGGEPLLNPEINAYIELTRRLYPRAVIFVVTNALLLPKMPDEFFDTLRRCNVAIHISFYPPLLSKASAIVELLNSKRVLYESDSLIRSFRMPQTLRPHNDAQGMFLQCNSAHCHNLYDGKMVVCPESFTTKYFNEYYNENLPLDGALDLYETGLTTEKLKRHLLTPFERCRYCNPPVNVEWKSIKHPSPLSDWVTDA